MSETTTIRVSRATHDDLRQLATQRRESLADTVAQALRALRQDDIGRDLRAPLSADEIAWLDADAG